MPINFGSEHHLALSIHYGHLLFWTSFSIVFFFFHLFLVYFMNFYYKTCTIQKKITKFIQKNILSDVGYNAIEAFKILHNQHPKIYRFLTSALIFYANLLAIPSTWFLYIISRLTLCINFLVDCTRVRLHTYTHSFETRPDPAGRPMTRG